jgi:hypothetical protein
MTRNPHSIEFQEQALIKVRERGTRSVQDVADDLNMSVGTLRKWISKSNRKAASSGPAVRLPDDLPGLSWGLPSGCKPFTKRMPWTRRSCMPGAGKRVCLNTN